MFPLLNSAPEPPNLQLETGMRLCTSCGDKDKNVENTFVFSFLFLFSASS